jgi:branched-chain amino acid transport system permease protein
VVTVVGGLGSIPGAFVAALLIAMTKSLCIAAGEVTIAGVSIAMPRITLVVEFIVMAIVLAIKPYGLFGAPPAAPATTPLPEQRALVRVPGRREAIVAVVIAAALAALPLVRDPYVLVLATDILIAALFTASLQFLTGIGGMTSFGHAAYFGIGAYAAALAHRHALPALAALCVAPLAAAASALAFGALCVRLSGVYLAMLTLAFAQIVWSIAFQWNSVTGGSNGITGVWPPEWLGERTAYYLFTLALVAFAWLALRIITASRFGYTLRAARDSPLRATAQGIDVKLRRWQGFALAGLFAGLAGGLFAFSKGSISPETLAIPRSVDALVMMLLGGINALFGPLLGAAAYTWLVDALSRATEYWRALVGVGILILVTLFPQGIGGGLERVMRRRDSR